MRTNRRQRVRYSRSMPDLLLVFTLICVSLAAAAYFPRENLADLQYLLAGRPAPRRFLFFTSSTLEIVIFLNIVLPALFGVVAVFLTRNTARRLAFAFVGWLLSIVVSFITVWCFSGLSIS